MTIEEYLRQTRNKLKLTDFWVAGGVYNMVSLVDASDKAEGKKLELIVKLLLDPVFLSYYG